MNSKILTPSSRQRNISINQREANHTAFIRKSLLTWNKEQPKLDYLQQLTLTTSKPVDAREKYYQKQGRNPNPDSDDFKNTSGAAGIAGFGEAFIREIENDVMPWLTAPEYDGGYAEGLKNGNGRCVYPNGDIFKGNYIKGKRSGAGLMWWADGRFYKGVFVDDQIKGKGIFKVASGPQSAIIDGLFDNGIIVPGPSKVQYPNGDIYEGRVNMQGQRDGSGRHFYKNGDLYEGNWLRNKRSGKGKLTFADGGVFTGAFQDDEAHDGQLIDCNDNKYENDLNKGGCFLRGKLNGFGTARFSNSTDYVGDFKDGLMSGQGTLTYKNGFGIGGKAIFVGNFRHNKRDGYGELFWGNSMSGGDGEVYKGLWHND